MKQGNNEILQIYLDFYKESIEVVNHCVRSVGYDPGIFK